MGMKRASTWIASDCRDEKSRVGIRGNRDNLGYMKTTSEIDLIVPPEKSVPELSAEVGKREPVKKDWRKMAGRLRDTEFAREADRLGREYREQQNVT